MSAAATAAGYLYASGRLRGRGTKEQEQHHDQQPRASQPKKDKPQQEIRVAVYQPEEKPKRVTKVEYRTRRWKPE